MWLARCLAGADSDSLCPLCLNVSLGTVSPRFPHVGAGADFLSEEMAFRRGEGAGPGCAATGWGEVSTCFLVTCTPGPARGEQRPQPASPTPHGAPTHLMLRDVLLTQVRPGSTSESTLTSPFGSKHPFI